MILSSCHHYSLNNDCHCHCCCHCHCHYMQRVYVYFNLSCLLLSYLLLPCLVFSWVDYYYYCYYRHDVVWARVTLSYHIISYDISCSFILSLLLIWSPFHFILFYSTLFQIDLIWFDSIRFDLILFYWIWFTVLFSIVSHINEWFVSVCPSVCLSVCLCVYLYE